MAERGAAEQSAGTAQSGGGNTSNETFGLGRKLHVVTPAAAQAPTTASSATNGPIPQRLNLSTAISKSSIPSTSGGVTVKKFDQGRRKVPVQRGFSQLDWAMLINSNKDLAGRNGAPIRKDITLEELSKHNTRYDCWMALHGRVYNVTRYVQYHPGGVEEILRGAGDDATHLFDEVHRWVNTEHTLKGCLVGFLAEEVADEKADKGFALHPYNWREFTVTQIERDSKSSIYLRFALPKGRKLGLQSVGEHLQICGRINGQITIRAYTPISLPDQEEVFDIAVKVVPTGRLSQMLASCTVGSKVLMRGPRGAVRFSALTREISHHMFTMKARRLVLISAGSGITPLLQVLRAIFLPSGKDLAEQGAGACEKVSALLINCNASREEVMCSALLAKIKEKAQESLKIIHFYSAESAANNLDPETEFVGPLRPEMLVKVVPPAEEDSAALFCGPPVFNEMIRATLRHIGYTPDLAYVF